MAEPAQDSELVKEFVVAAHTDLERTKELLASAPALVIAAWDWGGGDWETGLGGASHMGSREIALFLLDHGARMDIFAAAMLGYDGIVNSMLEAKPKLVNALGPHGIPLVAHAEAGGEDKVVRLLRYWAK